MPDVVKAITVTLAASSLTVGGTTQAKASVTTDVTDNALDDNFILTWTSSNAAVATVSPLGVVTAASAGTATISATSGLIAGSAPLTVVALPFVLVNDAAAQALIDKLPLGARFELRFPTAVFICQKDVS
jgi:uncharacterized protein YjdB